MEGEGNEVLSTQHVFINELWIPQPTDKQPTSLLNVLSCYICEWFAQRIAPRAILIYLYPVLWSAQLILQP